MGCRKRYQEPVLKTLRVAPNSFLRKARNELGATSLDVLRTGFGLNKLDTCSNKS